MLQLSLSVGAASAGPLQPPSVEELMNKADQYLYDQKRARKRLSVQSERTEGKG